MKTYAEILEGYRKRQQETVIDTIATGLTYMDELALDAGLLEETGLLTELSESVSGALPVTGLRRPVKRVTVTVPSVPTPPPTSILPLAFCGRST